MTGPFPAEFPTLRTERLILRETVADDADDILAFRGDAEVQRYNLVPMKSRSEALALVRTMRGWYTTGYAIQWGITVRDEDRVLGLCGLHDVSRARGRAAIGYDLLRSHWGQGVAGEAVRAVLRFGFEEMGLTRLVALTMTENARSIRLLQRLGFTLDSERQAGSQGAFDPGRYYDYDGRAIYSLLRNEYEPAEAPPPQG